MLISFAHLISNFFTSTELKIGEEGEFQEKVTMNTWAGALNTPKTVTFVKV